MRAPVMTRNARTARQETGTQPSHGPSLRIGVVAPGTRIEPDLAERVKAFAADSFLDRAPEIVFHPQCFLQRGSFRRRRCRARRGASSKSPTIPTFDALWFARGGYGACRMAEAALAKLNERARAKTYLGYSDAGAILGGLYKRGYPERGARADADRPDRARAARRR